MPPTIIFTVGIELVSAAALPPAELPPAAGVELLPQAARLRATAPAAATAKIGRFIIIVLRILLFVPNGTWVLIGVLRGGKLHPDQIAWASERFGGRHLRILCSSRLISDSAKSVTTAMITMQAKTVFGSNVPCAWLIIKPIPFCAPSTSATRAPM